MSQAWTNGIFGCFSDCGLCLITFLLPCYTQGKNAELVGENCLTHGIFAIIPLLNIYCHATIRGRIREKKNIDGTFFHDLLCACFCTPCALVQESRELAPKLQSMVRE